MSLEPADVARLGLGLAAIGRPAYITAGRGHDLGPPAQRTVASMRSRTHALLDSAWSAGIRYVDVARSYGRAEEFLGEWLAAHPGRRAQLRLGSKWGYEYVGNWRADAPLHERKQHSRAMLDKQWPQTLQALGGPPDWYLIHSVTPDSPALTDRDLLAALSELAATGIRIGLSTSGPAQAAVIERALALRSVPFSVVQSTWNLLEQSATQALLRAHAAGWQVIVKEVFANGRLAGTAAPPAIRQVAEQQGRTVESVALGTVLAQPWVDLALTGAVTGDQLAANLAADVAAPLPDLLHGLAVAAPEYWHARGELSWA
ncbi:MAG TPA: aldo/keto reductase [Jatrophihabitans sp.]|nr:aldo/keto reductase [Jatrophihabitans sp.]